MRVIGASLIVVLVAAFVIGIIFFNPNAHWLKSEETSDVKIKYEQPFATEQVLDKKYSGVTRFTAIVPGKHAQSHADWMATTGKFEHSDLVPLVDSYGVCRENICWVYGDATWEQAYEEWKNSPGHAANMKHGGRHVGFGRGFNGTHTYFVVIYTTRDPYFRDGF